MDFSEAAKANPTEKKNGKTDSKSAITWERIENGGDVTLHRKTNSLKIMSHRKWFRVAIDKISWFVNHCLTLINNASAIVKFLFIYLQEDKKHQRSWYV